MIRCYLSYHKNFSIALHRRLGRSPFFGRRLDSPTIFFTFTIYCKPTWLNQVVDSTALFRRLDCILKQTHFIHSLTHDSMEPTTWYGRVDESIQMRRRVDKMESTNPYNRVDESMKFNRRVNTIGIDKWI